MKILNILGSFIFGILIAFPIGLYLDKFEKIAQVITALSVAIAASQYLYQRRKDNSTIVADHISFFREKIMPSRQKLKKHIKEFNPEYKYPKIHILRDGNNPLVITARFKFEDETNQQSELMNKPDIYRSTSELLNLIEEFSLRVLIHKTENSIDLDVIKHLFISIIEENAWHILAGNAVSSKGVVFQRTLNLYFLWEKQIDKRTDEEILNEILGGYKKQITNN